MDGVQGNNLDNIKFWSSDFNGKYKTLFIKNENGYFVGAKSMVSGMGLSWGTQFKKIKNDFGYSFKKKIPGEHYGAKALAVSTFILPQYIDSIQISRVSEPVKSRVKEYKNGFVDFVCCETGIEDPNFDINVFDSYIEDGYDGIHRMIRDVSKINYLAGFERIAKILHELMISPDLSLDELILSNEIHEIADYLSKNQFKLKG